jgi:Pyruvate/2-oxoacid:ferredoxin oxidoreductase delta subunit
MENTGWDSLWIYYISGTGNARKSSEWIASEASARGIKTTVQKIDRLENIEFPSPEEKSLIGFAFPTHGFNAAPIMLRFIAGFPRRLSNDAFVLNTRAGMKLYKMFMPGISGIALILPALMLILKGYRCIAMKSVDLPSNWIPLHPGIKKKVIDSIFIRCEGNVRIFANKLLDGNKVFTGLISLPLDILLIPIALAYYVGGRFFLAKTFIANSKCDNCGLCIRECPTSSIRLVENRPYWKLTCESCMRCLNHCPKEAIETAHGMSLIFFLAFSSVNAWLIMLSLRLLNIEESTWWFTILKNIAGIIVMVLVTALLYRILHFTMRSAIMRSIVRFTSLTALPFWKRYKPGKR